VVDTRPRQFSQADKELLKRFARQAMHQIELRLAGQQLVQTQHKLRESEAQYRALATELESRVSERTQALAQANTQLQQANENLLRSNGNLEQFAYVASHDLQEPLRKIQSFGDILKSHYSDSLGEGIHHVMRMQAAANRMATLIKALLAYSRLSTRQQAITPVSLDQLVHTVLSDLEVVIAETRAEVKVEALPTVQGDALQLGQLFQNLLSNALKFHHPTNVPQIHITAQPIFATDLPALVKPSREAAVYHRIDVTDNGIGFEERYAERIFQVFQRLHGKSQYPGTGIGLAICEKVVANHGGAITAASQPGQGATFSVYLPAD
jgi:light-regulated signal transduction histidine kinase (bacteriophytochrome)